MRVTLIHNPRAGDATRTGRLVVEMLEDAGHDVSYMSTRKAWKKALKAAVKGKADLVVAAGGDGTVRKVALEVAGTGVPLAVLAIGTANNIGKTIGATGDARKLIERWERARPRPFDLGVAQAPWGTGHFVEALGGGLIPELIAIGDEIERTSPIVGRETDRALHALADLTRAARARRWGVRVDGRDRSGDYLAVEVMNIRFAGPNIPLAPRANPGDGRLNVALVRPEHRAALLGYLESRATLGHAVPPRLSVVTGREIELRPPADAVLHLDDRLWPEDPKKLAAGPVRVRVEAGAVRMLYGATGSRRRDG